MAIVNTAPTLEDLPSPPVGKAGWPWTEQTKPLPNLMPDGSEWPRLSIVTPNYNYGQFLEETIRSVLLQGYPNLEYIIIDGGSTDNSVEIIQKYEQWLTHWISESDVGQTDAIQRGFNLSNGILWNWLNSDDLLEPDALHIIANTYRNNSSSTVYSGQLKVARDEGFELHPRCFQHLSELVCVWEKWATPQPSIFLSSNTCREVGGLNTSLKYAMDYDLYLKLASLSSFRAEFVNNIVASFRLHPLSKTSSQRIAFNREILQVFDDFSQKHPLDLPQGWRKTRALFDYHLALDSSRGSFNQDLSLSSFTQISYSYFPYVWNYRFFWASLFLYVKQMFADYLSLS